MTNLQKEVIDLFKAQESYTLSRWGFSAMGHREVANILGVPYTSAANSMRSLFNSKVFHDRTAKDEWDETTYYMVNTDLKVLKFNEYGEMYTVDRYDN